MENIQATLSVLAVFGMRLAIPVAITVMLIIFLRWLDQRWQAAIDSRPDLVGSKPSNPGCWDVKHCTAEQRASCNAHAHPETPCWQIKRTANGPLQQECLGCKIFQNAIPVPVRQ